MKRPNMISYEPKGISKLYLDKISVDLYAELRSNAKLGVDVIPTKTAMLNRLISKYFVLQYGKEEQRKIRDVFFKDVFDDLEGDQANLVRKHEASQI